MSIYEILPALDLTQSIHDKICIRMHRGVKFLNFQNTFNRACDEIRLELQSRKCLRKLISTRLTLMMLTLTTKDTYWWYYITWSFVSGY